MSLTDFFRRDKEVDVPMPDTVLLKPQQDWIADDSEFKIGSKGRRVGLTWSEAADDVLIAAKAEKDGGMNVYYSGYNQDMAVEFIEACVGWAKAFHAIALEVEEGIWEEGKEDKEIKTFTVKFPDSGHRIVALSSRPNNFRGKKGVAVLDEFAFSDSQRELLKSVMAFIIWGGKVRVISTHDGEHSHFNEVIKEIRAGKRKGSVHEYYFMDAVRAGMYERVCLRMGIKHSKKAEQEWIDSVYSIYGEDAAEELDGIPKSGTGGYFTRVIIEQCQREGIPVIRWAKPTEWVTDSDRIDETKLWLKDVIKPILDNIPSDKRTVGGQDFGRSGDLSAHRYMYDNGGGEWVTFLDLELRNLPFDVQWCITEFILDNLPNFHHICFDARGNGSEHAEKALQKFGEQRVTRVMATTSWYAENFPPYKAAHEDKSIVIPDDEDNITDHRRVILKKGTPGMDDGRDKGSDGGFRHGDRAIAGVMAWTATRTDGQPPSGSTIKPDHLSMVPQSQKQFNAGSLFNRVTGGLFRK